jgi:RNA polymerase sigma-70 factor (ECF subfamily)
MARESTEQSGSQEDRFLKVFEDYSDALFRHASIRISDREKALDLVHDTYTKVWVYVKNGQKIDSYRPFLYKVLNNLIIDTYRKKTESSLDALLEQDGVDEGSFPELSESTTEALAATIDGRQAFTLLATLPDQYKEVLILRFVDELGPREIAALVEESENVVSVRIHRGLQMLRKILNEKIESREQNRKDRAAKK